MENKSLLGSQMMVITCNILKCSQLQQFMYSQHTWLTPPCGRQQTGGWPSPQSWWRTSWSTGSETSCTWTACNAHHTQHKYIHAKRKSNSRFSFSVYSIFFESAITCACVMLIHHEILCTTATKHNNVLGDCSHFLFSRALRFNTFTLPWFW